MEDWKLLREYVEQSSQIAFTHLVERHVNFVYSICLREVGNPALAEDVTQVVFLILARKAASIREGTVLMGWLFNTARFVAKDMRRQELRRQKREQKAAEEMIWQAHNQHIDWHIIEPHLHDALAGLNQRERNAVLLRFFEGKNLRETGEALGISEEAARKRITRALDKLRLYFAKHGFAISGVVLVTLVTEHAMQAAPSTCLASIAQAASVSTGSVTTLTTQVLGAKIVTAAQESLHAMFIAQMKSAAAACVSLSLVGVGVHGAVQLAMAHTPPRQHQHQRPNQTGDLSILPKTVSAISRSTSASHKDKLTEVVTSHNKLVRQVAAQPRVIFDTPSANHRDAPFSVKKSSFAKASLKSFRHHVLRPLNAVDTTIPTVSPTTAHGSPLSDLRLAQAPIAARADPIGADASEAKPLNARLAGRVVDAAGQAVAGAKVMSPDGDPNVVVTTDAQGSFVLPSLPLAEVMVIAATQTGVAEARNVDTRKTNPPAKLSLVLQPLKKQKSPDLERAFEVVEELSATLPFQPRRVGLLLSLIPHDPERVLQMVTRRDGTISNDDMHILSQAIIERAAREPNRVMQWARPRLSQLKEDYWIIRTKVLLAMVMAESDPELSEDLYQEAQKTNEEYNNSIIRRKISDSRGMAMRAIWFSMLARKLQKEDEAERYAQLATKHIHVMPELERPRGLILLAIVNPEYALGMIDELPMGERRLQLQAGIQRSLSYDISLAKKLLTKLVQLEQANIPAVPPDEGANSEVYPYAAGVAQQVVEAIGKSNPAEALEIAGSMTEYFKPYGHNGMLAKVQILATAAAYQDKEVARQMLPEVADLAVHPRVPIGVATRIASVMYDVDAQRAMQLFTTTKQRLESIKNMSHAERLRLYPRSEDYSNGLDAFAYYYSRVNPGESRLMLEAEFAIKRKRAIKLAAHRQTGAVAVSTGTNLTGGPGLTGGAHQPADVRLLNFQLVGLVTAMVAIDVDRALELAWLLPSDKTDPLDHGDGSQSQAQGFIADYLLLAEFERHHRAFMQWKLPNSHNLPI